MARSIWKGTIKFGLVSVPIKMYSAIETSKTSMHQYHEKDNGKIRYKKVCETCKNEVTQDEIIKGVLVQQKLVTIAGDELKQIRPDKNKWIEVVQFVPAHQIESFYFNSHYYLGAEQKMDKTFFLFRDALRQCAKTAIGRFVFKEKEYACAIEAYGNGLLLTTLNYNDEIRNIDLIANISEEPEISDEEMKLARMIIDQKSVDDLDMSQFIDTFKTDLEQLIATKAAGESPTIVEKVEANQPATNLVEMLQASVGYSNGAKA
jgi:DNA end-binding protein Ku